MNQISKPHHHPKGKVPFSWENKPGVPKITTQEYLTKEDIIKLPPPPCPIGRSPKISPHHQIQVPLPPCAFQPPPSRTSSRKGRHDKKADDPFLAAYKECTKSTKTSSSSIKLFRRGRAGPTKGIFNISCKQSCSVRDDTLVRISQLRCESREPETDETWHYL